MPLGSHCGDLRKIPLCILARKSNHFEIEPVFSIRKSYSPGEETLLDFYLPETTPEVHSLGLWSRTTKDWDSVIGSLSLQLATTSKAFHYNSRKVSISSKSEWVHVKKTRSPDVGQFHHQNKY